MSALHDAMARLEEVAQDPHERRSVRSTEERNKLVEENQRLAAWGANRFAGGVGRHDPDLFEDLRQAALLAMLRAAELWDPSLGEFGNYAVDWVETAIHRELVRSSLIRLPYNMTREERERARKRIRVTTIPDQSSHPYYTETPELDPEADATHFLVTAKACMSPAQFTAFRMFYFEGKSYQQIWEEMGLDRGRVSWLLVQARKKLGKAMGRD